MENTIGRNLHVRKKIGRTNTQYRKKEGKEGWTKIGLRNRTRGRIGKERKEKTREGKRNPVTMLERRGTGRKREEEN